MQRSESAIERRLVDVGDLRLNVAIAGSGPLVIFCHGFPGLWYSWRHQLPALAAVGYRAVAIDQRGYGRSDRPVNAALYDANHVMNDVLRVMDALGERQAVAVGHDFGAQQVCNLAVRHRERVKAVVIMSCPYDFDLAGRGGRGRRGGANAAGGFATGVKPSVAFAAAARDRFFHMHYFQSIGAPERELGGAPREFLTRLFWALSGEGGYTGYADYPPQGTGYLDVLPPAPPLPWRWMSVDDMNYYVAEFARTGPDTAFIGGLNSYRVADRNWELGEPYADANIEVPALFVAGAEDLVLRMIASDALDIMRSRVPDLRGIELVPGSGHFVQMEQPAATNRALLHFLAGLA
jgi:pimeloyl-ACP methyl ester carboxylesterase